MKPNLNNFILFDGGFGTMLQKYGMATGEKPDLLNLSAPDTVKRIHSEYVAAGADVITTNTFGANSYKLNGDASVKDVVTAAVNLAKASGVKYVALDIGPIGTLLEPYGKLTSEDAYEMFREQVVAGRDAGADVIIIETMSDLLEAKTAVLAAKENSDLPIFATMTYAEDGRTFLGTDPISATVTLCSLGVDAVGVNCSLGPDKLDGVIDQILSYATCPVIVQPNAGLPEMENGETVYKISPESYCANVEKFIDKGVT
ncbi:MAG: homocysteine S-methyltransferase family protein, partial [Eubacteriales bacterium]